VSVGHFFHNVIDAPHEVGPVVPASSLSTGATGILCVPPTRAPPRAHPLQQVRLAAAKGPAREPP
jgi:hypothetical protein